MLSIVFLVLIVFCVCGWLFLCYGRGGFWRANQRLPKSLPDAPMWGDVVAVIPARNEAECIGRTVASLLAQDYPGTLRVVVVDDGSSDGTAEAALAAARGSERLSILAGEPLPAGWTGKLWAVQQGVTWVTRQFPDSAFLLLTDADIEHDSTNVRRLVAKAERGRYQLVSLMVQLRCHTFWERLLVPPFIFFFQKLYPFAWVNDPRRPEAAAAGGCMLVRAPALAAAGGIAAIRGRLIDDCALAALLKEQGAIWLGLSHETRSLRPYDRLAEFWAMVARSAYTQLGYSRRLLLATVCVMTVQYLTPPAAIVYGVIVANLWIAILGVLAWSVMVAMFTPTLMLYRMPTAWGLALPLAALLYVLMTIDSARLTWQGRGGLWKGRSFSARADSDLSSA
ncbi:MAG: glycosyltransferase [Rhodospirillales bacterium]|nr:glycosyltransferase [Rhodospirillales bacterium]